MDKDKFGVVSLIKSIYKFSSFAVAQWAIGSHYPKSNIDGRHTNFNVCF